MNDESFQQWIYNAIRTDTNVKWTKIDHIAYQWTCRLTKRKETAHQWTEEVIKQSESRLPEM
jgi:hypothetical protein